MSLEEYKGVFVFAQQVDNVLDGVAFELLGKGKDLAKDLNTEVTAVLIGSGVKGLADQLAEYGADRVIVVDDPELKEYRTEPYAHALASVINEYKPEIMLVGATAIGRDLGPTVSARVKTGLTADCTSLEIGDFPLVAAPGKESEQKHNQLLMTRPAFGGNTIATIACPDNRPQMATVRPGVMQKIAPIAGAKANVVEFNPGFTPNNRYVEILNVVKAVKSTANIMEAKILVSGGRGVGSKENFKLLEADKFCKSAYFIEEGMTRSFWLVNGEEITTSFACEGAIVFSMDELYYNKMSEEFVETLEDVVAYRISLTDLLRLFQTNIELANWGRVIHQNEYRRLHRSHKDRLTLSAKERYEAFKLQFPQMCQRIQLGYIASYLGITLSTLSRLRAYK